MSVVGEQMWYKQWVGTVGTALEQAAKFGATDIILLGIKGVSGSNYATMNEWPALLLDLQDGFAAGKMKGPPNFWEMVEERRIDIAKLSKVVARMGKAMAACCGL
jgi:hypothetical protein